MKRQIEFEADHFNAIKCPSCGDIYMHASNPRHEDGDFCVDFWCECCGPEWKYRLMFYFNKGQTYLVWDKAVANKEF